MTELLQSELLRRLAELELRVDLLAKALAGVTSGNLDRTAAPTLTGIVCGKCGADRLTEGCRLANQVLCTFAGEAQ